MQVTQRGLEFIKSFEGLAPLAYQDIAGVWTIGYGHTGADLDMALECLARGNQFNNGFFATTGGEVRTNERQAARLLEKDLQAPLEKVGSVFANFLVPHEVDALSSFLLNVGTAAFAPSVNPNTSARAAMALQGLVELEGRCGPARAAALRPLADALLWWNKATVGGKRVEVRGLSRRRTEEAELLLYGDYELVDDGVVNAPGIRAE